MSGDTTTLTWPRRGTFVDRNVAGDRRSPERFESDPSDNDFATVDVDDPDRKEAYLDAGWVEGTPEDNGLVDDGAATSGAAEAAEQIDPDVFVQAFVAQDATDQVAAIEAGEVDGYLDAIEAANEQGEDYATVQEAIDARRGEIGG